MNMSMNMSMNMNMNMKHDMMKMNINMMYTQEEGDLIVGDNPSNKGDDDPNPISIKDVQVAPTRSLQTHLHAPCTSAFRSFICPSRP